MAAFSKRTMHDANGLVNGYDWSSINGQGGTFVDLGGANGHASVAIARANPNMHFVVQEMLDVVEKAKYHIPQDVADRVQCMAHDFFQPQPVAAQAYPFRQIFHNWGDDNFIKILRALIPALKPGAKIIANEFVLTPPGVLPMTQEKGLRAMDMIVMSLFNARERESADWKALLAQADSRFQNVQAWKPVDSQLGLIEVTWSS